MCRVFFYSRCCGLISIQFKNRGTIASDIYHNEIITTHAYVLYYDKSSRQIIIINPILQCSSADVMIICRQKPLNSSYLTYMYIVFMVIHLNTHLKRGTRRRCTDQTGLSNISTREIITRCSGQWLIQINNNSCLKNYVKS